MNRLKNFSFVLLVLLVVLVLVIVRTTGKNRFKVDAKNTIETVASGNFSISVGELKATQSEYLIVDLSKPGNSQFNNSLQISFEKLVEESSVQKLKEIDSKIVLVSDDESKAEKAWVILTQLGIQNVFVLSNEENPEVLKYEFQPDTAVRLESITE